ncbi:MAG: MFS transporter, partial [Actinomycetota bacterium]
MSRRFSAAFVDISPLRESTPYRALWLGQLVSLLGTNMRFVAVAWQIFALTGSTVAVGLVGLVEVVPLIAFSILGGAIVDTSDRKRLIIVTQIGMMVTSVALVVLAFSTDPSILWIYGVLAVGSAFSAVDRPARSALVPALVSEHHIASTMALRQILFHTTTIVGPAIGGVLISAFDVGAVYLVDAVSFTAVLIATRWIPSFPKVEQRHDTRLQTIKEGLL